MKGSQLLKILKQDGWYVISQEGSHLKMAHPTKRTPLASGYLIFAFHGSDEVGKNAYHDIKKKAGLK